MPCLTPCFPLASQVHAMREKLAAAAAEASRLQRLRTEQNAHQRAAMLQVRKRGVGTQVMTLAVPSNHSTKLLRRSGLSALRRLRSRRLEVSAAEMSNVSGQTLARTKAAVCVLTHSMTNLATNRPCADEAVVFAGLAAAATAATAGAAAAAAGRSGDAAGHSLTGARPYLSARQFPASAESGGPALDHQAADSHPAMSCYF